MFIELGKRNLHIEKQKSIVVYSDEENVGNYFTDLFVSNKVIIELKASEGLREEHEAQLVNYFRATDIEVRLLLNLGVKPSIKRKIFENHLKK